MSNPKKSKSRRKPPGNPPELLQLGDDWKGAVKKALVKGKPPRKQKGQQV